MSTPVERPQLLHTQNSYSKSNKNHEQSLYYHDNYAIENFINVYARSESDMFNAFSDPTYVGFKLFFHFDATSGLFANEQHTNSALAYLKRIGQTQRYELLGRFINVLSRVNSETPWIFQSIDGLDEMYNTPFHEVYVNKELSIQTLETIDGKISSLAQMYRNIVYDYERKVEIIPRNLRHFSMSIYLYDFRNFDNLSQTAVDALQTIKNQDVRNLNHIMFDVGYCEFDVTSGSVFVSQATNSEPGIATNNLKIKYEKFAVSSLFKTITGDTELSAESFSLLQAGVLSQTEYRPKNGLRKLADSVKDDIAGILDVDAWKTKVRDAVDDVGRRFIDLIRSRLTGLYLGNVHEYQLQDILRYGSDPNYRVQFNDIYSKIQGNRSLAYGNTDTTIDKLGNVNNR